MKPTRRQRKAATARSIRAAMVHVFGPRHRFVRDLTQPTQDRFVQLITMPSPLLSLVKVVPMEAPLQGEEAGEVVSDLRALMTPEDRRENRIDSFVCGNAAIEVHRDDSGKVIGASHVPFQARL